MIKMPPHKWEPFTLLYLRANPEMVGAVTGYVVRANCPVQYLITWGEDAAEQWHWEGELTDQKTYGAGGGGE